VEKDRRLGRVVLLRKQNGMERRMKKLMEVGREGKLRDDTEVGDEDATPSPSTPFLA